MVTAVPDNTKQATSYPPRLAPVLLSGAGRIAAVHPPRHCSWDSAPRRILMHSQYNRMVKCDALRIAAVHVLSARRHAGRGRAGGAGMATLEMARARR
jgi:hypothetical protein